MKNFEDNKMNNGNHYGEDKEHGNNGNHNGQNGTKGNGEHGRDSKAGESHAEAPSNRWW